MYSKEMHALIKDCLNLNAAKRPTCNQMLKMPIITNRIKNYLTNTVF
jgi:NIMA (never in mitosis gene a)-related kinase 1/4/5